MSAEAATRAGAGYATVAVPAELEPIFEVKLTEVMSVGCPSADGAPDAATPPSRSSRRPSARPRSSSDPGSVAPRRASSWSRERRAAVRGAAGDRRRRAQRARRAARAARRARGPDGAHARTPASSGGCSSVDSDEVGSPAPRPRARGGRARRGDRRAQGRRHDRRRARRARRSSTALASPALATAGTGDVLSGMIAALIARGLEPRTAAAAAVHAHTRAGRVAAGRDRRRRVGDRRPT